MTLFILLFVLVTIFTVYKQVITIFMDINYEIDSYKQQLLHQDTIRNINVNLDQNNEINYYRKHYEYLELSEITEPPSKSLFSELHCDDKCQLILPESLQTPSMNYQIRQQ
ncbi:Hypothetical_protein [Hexamita inflata]|uniref:Hypothetical_protein n=1 Tax=Hexamita inflata TaxID=28002 RepID=A0AA86U4G5_9EUKA|nr:Hypothetical protein HINF_LOCUS26851 [Hexamita inflata]